MSTDPVLVQAVLALARQDDGALTRDAVGYNGSDTKFGNRLAKTPPEGWSVEVQREAWEMLAKYKRQLAGMGIDYDAIVEPKAGKGLRGVRTVDVRNGKVLVFLPYGDSAYPKSALSAVWNSEEKAWYVPALKHGSVIGWAERNDVPVTDRARAVLEQAPKLAGPQWLGTAVLERGKGIVLKFDYNPVLLDAVRTIQGRRWDADDKSWIIPVESISLLRKVAEQHKIFMTEDVKSLPDKEIDTSPKIMVQGKSFAISFNYDADMISQVRQMPGSVWSPPHRMWLVPIESADEVLKFKDEHHARVSDDALELMGEAEDVQAIIEASQAHDADITIKGFGNETFKLFPFQRAGVAYAMRAMGFEYQDGDWVRTLTSAKPDENGMVSLLPSKGGVLIGDEMGLGKSPMGLATLQASQSFPAVIVVPASLKLNWQREANRWIPDAVVKIISGTSGNLPDADIWIINYDILSHWVEKFPPLKGIVLDESHYIKNGSALRSKACIRLSDKVMDGGVRVCLSGTPIVNTPTEIITQLRVINRLEEFGGATAFRNTYGHASAKSLASLNRKLRSSCYVRRRKAEVLTELPPKVWNSIVVEGDPTIMKEYKKAEADIIRYLSEQALQLARESGASDKEAQNEAWRKALRARSAEHLVSITTLKQISARAKMKATEEWIANFLETDKKLIVFGWHRDVVDMVADKFSNGVKIQGGLTGERRQEAVDKFQNEDSQKVIACNIKAAGVGLTLTASSDVLFIEQGWTPSDMEQAVDRAHRIGQKDSVTGWLMLTANTIDEDIASLIDHKRSIVNRAIDGTDNDDEEAGTIMGDLLVALAERGMANQ